MNYLRLVAATAASVLVPFACAQDKPVAVGAPAVEAVAKRVAPTNLVVGIVDLTRAIDEYPKAIDLEKQLAELGNQSRSQLDEITKRMEEVRGAIDVLGPDAPDRRQHEGNLQLLQLQRNLRAKELDERFEMARVKMMLEIYSDIEVAINKVAKARGLHIVQCTHENPNPEDVAKLVGRGALARLGQYENRTIWYAAAELDVTADLIKVLLVPIEDTRPKDGKAGEPKLNDKAEKEPKPGDKAAPPSAGSKGKGQE